MNRRGVWDQRGPRTGQVLVATGAQATGTALAVTICVVHWMFRDNSYYIHLFSGISDNIQLNGICRGKKMPPNTVSS